MLQPREDERHSMHGLDMAGCPTNAPNLCDVAAEDVISSYMVMQHAQDFKPTPLTLRPSSNSNHKNGPLVEPSLNNTHHDGSGPKMHSGITTQPTPHSHFEHPLSHPTILRTRDGNAGTTLERVVPRAHSRRDSKLCSHSSPSTDCNAMESNDANAESPTKARPTSPLPPLSQPPVPCPGPQDQPPLSHSNKAITRFTGQAAEHPDELLQCSLPKPSARSHFPLLGSRRDKHCNARKRTQPLHNYVLKPQPTIFRIRHALGQAPRGGSPVPPQDHITEAPVPPSADIEDSYVMGSPK